MAAMLLLASCSKDVNVKLSNDNLQFEAAGGSAEVNVESNGAWQVSDVPEWLTISPLSGEGNSSLSVSCLANTGSQARSAQIKVTTKDNVATFAVKQAFVEADFISFTPDSLNCDFQGGEFSIKVEANCDWSIATLPNWIQCEPMSGSHSANIVITIGHYILSSEGNREFNIDFVVGEQHFYLPVSQANDEEYHVVVNPNVLDFSAEGGSQTVALQSITSWTADCDVDWVSFNPASGEGDGELTVNVSSNTDFASRNARIVLTSSVGCVTNLMVRQEAFVNPHYLTVNPTSLSFPHTQSSLELAVSSDSLWYIQCNTPWLSFSSYTGIGESTTTVTAAEYTLLGNRRAEFQVISGSMRQTVFVTQESAYSELVLYFNPHHLQFDSEHETSLVSISANVNWELNICQEWLNIDIKEGSGDTQIQVEARPNPNQEPRTGFINLCYLGRPYDTLTVEQEACVYYVEADVDELQVESQGNSFTISVSANQQWTVGSDVNWMHFEPNQGIGDETVTLTVDPNNTTSPRSALIYLKGIISGVKTIQVTQSN